MIIPTPEYDPLFADDGVPFQSKMIRYIHREFSDSMVAQIGMFHSSKGPRSLSVVDKHGPENGHHEPNAA